MALHGGSWRVQASAVDDIGLITDSIKWLCGHDEEVSVEKVKSALGAPMYTIQCKMKSRNAKESLARINAESLSAIINRGIEELIDRDKILHIRIDLGSLVRGEGVVVRKSQGVVVKGRFKLEVYPGQDPTMVAEELIKELAG